jgi:pimeloyl-ACP methyl ester carboxylesterase
MQLIERTLGAHAGRVLYGGFNMTLTTLKNSAVSLAWEEMGSGVPLVLVHAFPMDRRMWLRQITGLSDRFRVITLDLPGFGQSGPAPAGFSIDSAAGIISEWLHEIGVKERVILGGVSMGGYISMAFARHHSDQLRGLILANTRPTGDDETTKANRAKMIELARNQGSQAVIESMISEKSRTEQPDLAEAVRALGASQHPDGVAAAIEALRDRPDATEGLKKISVPTLVIVGAEDAITPVPHAEQIANAVPGAKLEVIPHVGHLSNMEAPEEFNRLVGAAITVG